METLTNSTPFPPDFQPANACSFHSPPFWSTLEVCLPRLIICHSSRVSTPVYATVGSGAKTAPMRQMNSGFSLDGAVKSRAKGSFCGGHLSADGRSRCSGHTGQRACAQRYRLASVAEHSRNVRRRWCDITDNLSFIEAFVFSKRTSL